MIELKATDSPCPPPPPGASEFPEIKGLWEIKGPEARVFPPPQSSETGSQLKPFQYQSQVWRATEKDHQYHPRSCYVFVQTDCFQGDPMYGVLSSPLNGTSQIYWSTNFLHCSKLPQITRMLELIVFPPQESTSVFPGHHFQKPKMHINSLQLPPPQNPSPNQLIFN